MKYCKRFTEGLAFFACFLIMIFLVSSYVKFGGFSVYDEESGETMTFMMQRGVKQYVILFGLLLGSAVTGTVSDRLPIIGMITAQFPLFYFMMQVSKKQLVACKNEHIIMILIVLFAVGELVATAQWIRDTIIKANKKTTAV